MTINFNSRPKNTVRELLLNWTQFTHGLTLPASEAICARQLIRNCRNDGVARSLVCVDRDFRVLQAAKSRIQALACKHPNPPTIAYVPGDLSACSGVLHSLDFAFLDLCGPMNLDIARWMRTDLQQAMARKCTIAGTLARSCRCAIFMEWVRDFFADDPNAYDLYAMCTQLARKATGIVGTYRNGAWQRREHLEEVPLQQLAVFMLLWPAKDIEVQHFLLYPSVSGTSSTGYHMTAYALTLRNRRKPAPAWFTRMVKRFEQRVLSRERTYDRELVDRAVAAYKAKKFRTAKRLWDTATVGQRIIISRITKKRIRSL